MGAGKELRVGLCPYAIPKTHPMPKKHPMSKTTILLMETYHQHENFTYSGFGLKYDVRLLFSRKEFFGSGVLPLNLQKFLGILAFVSISGIVSFSYRPNPTPKTG